jgi:putative sigma-54 modulation protein
MRVEITARSLEITESMRDHIEKRVQKFTRYYDGVLECHVIARLERFIHKFEITLHGNGFDLFAEAHDEDLPVAFENAAEKMERQVRKMKDKIKRRRTRKPEVAAVEETEYEEESDVASEFEGR